MFLELSSKSKFQILLKLEKYNWSLVYTRRFIFICCLHLSRPPTLKLWLEEIPQRKILKSKTFQRGKGLKIWSSTPAEGQIFVRVLVIMSLPQSLPQSGQFTIEISIVWFGLWLTLSPTKPRPIFTSCYYQTEIDSTYCLANCTFWQVTLLSNMNYFRCNLNDFFNGILTSIDVRSVMGLV